MRWAQKEENTAVFRVFPEAFAMLKASSNN
jgi:hypothetical protein